MHGRCPDRARAVGLFAQFGSSVPVSERRDARRYDRGGGGHRRPLPRHARRDERGGERRRIAARQPGRGGGRDPRRHDPRHRPLPRRERRCDGSVRHRAVLALFGEPGVDARRGGARARQGRDAPRISPRTATMSPSRSPASAAGRGTMRRDSAGWGRTCGTRTVSSSIRGRSTYSRAPARGSRIARARTAGSGAAPLPATLDGHVRVGIGVDGSASNDSGNLLLEARQAL